MSPFRIKHSLLFFSFFLFFVSCSKDDGPSNGMDPPPEEKLDLIISDNIQVNPTGYAPLSAVVNLETKEDARVTLKIIGKDGPGSDMVKEFSELGSQLTIPVHGLYSNTETEVELSFYNSAGNLLGTQAYSIGTQGLLNALPLITIEQAQRSRMTAGMTLVSYFGYSAAIFPQRPFIFDGYGKIRWYLDFTSHPSLGSLFYDDGIERLSNGNFYFGSGGNNFGAVADNRIYEVDLFGNVINTWEMPGYGFHHQVVEKPNGNFLVTVNKLEATTIEDYIIEIDRNTGEILKEWNLNDSMENSRTTWTTDGTDWFHANGLVYDPFDDTIIVSGRTQGVVKLNPDNQVVWILGPHKGWGLSGTGQDLNQFLLQPLDGTGQAITDPGVLEGDTNHPEFEWAWYQHAPELMPNGDLLLFDNGDNRNYTGNEIYSRAVSFHIDSGLQTIQQQWEYGKERGEETYSRIVSDVDYLPAMEHILFSPGAIQLGGAAYGKSIEIEMSTGEVVFEATIVPPQAFANIITFHRTERLSLYPD